MSYSESERKFDSLKNDENLFYFKELSDMVEMAEKMSQDKEELQAELLKIRTNISIYLILFLFTNIVIIFTVFYGVINDKISLYISGLILIICSALFLIFFIFYQKASSEIKSINNELKFQSGNLTILINSIFEYSDFLSSKNALSPIDEFKMDFKLKMLRFKTRK